jgi:disulfide oxidoreductase YuzD
VTEVIVYGAQELCASCLHAPSSTETASWLEAALKRVYAHDALQVRYVDIHQPVGEQDQLFSKRIMEEDLWYPVVVIQGDVITEGNPDLKVIYKKLDELGILRKD